MKSSVAFAGLALASAICEDAASCEAETTCHIDIQAGPGQSLSCDFPDIRAACCDTFSIGNECQGDMDCMQSHMAAMPQAETQWLMSNGGGPSACPGLAALQSDPNSMMSHCQMPSGELAAEHRPNMGSWRAPLMMIQMPKPVVLAASGCTDAASCEAETTCHIDMQAGPGQSLSCDFPDIRAACCDTFSIGNECQGDMDCMQSHMSAMPQAETQWLMSNGGGPSACPGLAALQSDPNSMMSHCQMPSGELAAEHRPNMGSWRAPLMMLQVLQPQAQSSSLVPGMLGFAAGAAVVTSIVALKKQRRSDLYTPLSENSA